jgi:hypothetical protein
VVSSQLLTVKDDSVQDVDKVAVELISPKSSALLCQL